MGKVSGCRYVSDCRSRGGKFDPSPVPYFHGDWSWNNFYPHSPPFADSRRVVVSYKQKYVHEVLVNCLVKLALGKQCAYASWLSQHDHSCWLEHKDSNQTNKQETSYFVGTCILVFVCFCCFASHVNSYGHCGTVSSLNHTFSWAGLSKRLTSNLCTYFRL